MFNKVKSLFSKRPTEIYVPEDDENFDPGYVPSDDAPKSVPGHPVGGKLSE